MTQGNGPSADSKATEWTLREVADAMPGGTGTSLATEAKQDDQIALLTSMDADTGSLANSIRATGSAVAGLFQVQGGWSPSQSKYYPNTINVDGTPYDPLTEMSGSAGTGYAGTEIELGSGLTPGETYYLDSVGVAGTDDGGAGAASVTVYIMSATGQTPGASSKQLLVSNAISIAGGNFADTVVPNKRSGFIAPASGKVYGFVVPDAATLIVTDITARLTRRG